MRRIDLRLRFRLQITNILIRETEWAGKQVDCKLIENRGSYQTGDHQY
jgi:hypothetical protein